jgi:hypothetical protein
MEFVRRRKRGQGKKVRRTWFSEEGYRIIWRKEVHGVCVAARFQACVRTLIPYSGGELRQMWDFVNHKRRLIKTLKAAIEECERHRRQWAQACEAGGVRVLRELFGGKLPTGLPLWARRKMDRRLYAILTDTRPSVKYRDDEEDEPCTESSQPASDAPGPGGPFSSAPTEATSEIATPALPAEGKAESTTRRTRRGRSNATSESDASTVPRAEAAARKKPAARLIGKASKHTAKRKTSTTASSASGVKRSKGSRKKKSKL